MTSRALPDKGTGAALCAAGAKAAIAKAVASCQGSDRRVGIFMNSFEKIRHTRSVVNLSNTYLFALVRYCQF